MPEPRARILIVDDDPIVSRSLSEFLSGEGFEPSSAPGAREGLAALQAADDADQPIDLVVCDLSLPGGMDGLEFLRRIAREHPGVASVMLTGYASIPSAVESLRLGAADYLTKPVMDDELRVALERALRQRELLAENHALRRQLDRRPALDHVIGSDHRMAKVLELIDAVAPSRTTVLMTGESGVGKSMIAHAIHRKSPRRDKPYVELSCGSIPETLLESELFGHVKGAFTGAHANKAGRFLAAHTGTIFLDEINSASPAMQLKLLRVLQERKFEPVGSSETMEVDVRVILASNQPLEQLVAEGRFRSDLYYRINVVKIELPPLRDRVADIVPLAEHFLGIHASALGKQLAGFSSEAVAALQRYTYPGNVRELQNIVERAAVLSRKPTIAAEDLPSHVLENISPLAAPPRDEDAWVPMPLADALREPEKSIIARALAANAWNRQKTADVLGINRTTLYKKMKQYGLDRRAS